MPDLDEDLAAQRSIYASYDELKGWNRPFEYDAELAKYYGGEFGGADLRGSRLLEIGFGSGSLLAWARDRGANVVGTEINVRCLASAAERGVETFSKPLSEAAADYPQVFDWIVAFDVFEHLRVAEIVASLAACEAMLKPRGRLLLRFPNAQSPFGLAPQYADITHMTPLSGEIMRQLCAGTRLSVAADRPIYPSLGIGLPRQAARVLRHGLQRLIDGFFSFVYAAPMKLAPVVVVELRKDWQ